MNFGQAVSSSNCCLASPLTRLPGTPWALPPFVLPSGMRSGTPWRSVLLSCICCRSPLALDNHFLGGDHLHTSSTWCSSLAAGTGLESPFFSATSAHHGCGTVEACS